MEFQSKASNQPAAPIASHLAEVIRELGEDPEREGLARTPERAEKALRYLTSGYSADAETPVTP